MKHMSPKRTLLVGLFILTFSFGLSLVNFDTALAQGAFPGTGTFSCKWVEQATTPCQVDPTKVNCIGDNVPFVNRCTFLPEADCRAAIKQLCVAPQLGEETGTSPKTPTPKTGTAGCKWDPKVIVGINKLGKCETAKPECAPDHVPPSWLNCEGINDRDDWNLKQKKAGCEQVGLGKVACVSEETGTQPKQPETGTPAKEFSIKNPLKAGTIPEILDAVADFIFAIGIALVTVMVLWAGFQILTSAGSSEQIDKGKRTLLWAVIGTVVLLISFGIATLVSNILGGESSPNSASPGTAHCEWKAGEGCRPIVKCESGFTAPASLNCGKGGTPSECGAISAKTCVEK